MKIKDYVLGLLIIVLINGHAINSYATDSQNSVSVNIKYNIVYARDGKKIIDVGDVLIRDKDIYISLEDLQQILGSEISFQDNTVNIISRTELEEDKDPIKLDKVKITNIDSIQKKLTVVPFHKSNESWESMTLEIDEVCKIIYKELNKAIPLNMLEEGMIISIEYEPVLAEEEEALPQATEITILEDAQENEEPSLVIEDVEIIGIYKEKGYIEVAYSNQEKGGLENKIIIHIDDNTNIRDEEDNPYTIEELAIGQKINIITNGILTQSIPPQTLGLDIVIIDKSKEIEGP